LDGDIIAYKAAVLNEANAGTLDDLERLVKGIITDWLKASETSSFLVCLSTRCFRYAVAENYKAHRTDKPKPVDLGAAHKILETFGFYRYPDLEADDVMGILSTETPGVYTVVSTDKDLLQIPGRHCNPDKKITQIVTPESGLVTFLRQWLTGDSSDGYLGCPKVGPKKAEKIICDALDDLSSREYVNLDDYPAILIRTVLDEYRDRGQTYQYALQQARLARILTTELVDDNMRPILWEPPKDALVGLTDWVTAGAS
jgi:DNA polymerase-1